MMAVNRITISVDEMPFLRFEPETYGLLSIIIAMNLSPQITGLRYTIQSSEFLIIPIDREA